MLKKIYKYISPDVHFLLVTIIHKQEELSFFFLNIAGLSLQLNAAQ